MSDHLSADWLHWMSAFQMGSKYAAQQQRNNTSVADYYSLLVVIKHINIYPHNIQQETLEWNIAFYIRLEIMGTIT